MSSALTSASAKAFRSADAKNRSVRTFLTGLAIDVAVAVCLLLGTVLLTANKWGDLEWTLLSFSFAKSILQAIAAYVLRQFLDPSKLRTPLPPANPGLPVEGTRGGDERGEGALQLLLVVVVIVVVLWFLLQLLQRA